MNSGDCLAQWQSSFPMCVSFQSKIECIQTCPKFTDIFLLYKPLGFKLPFHEFSWAIVTRSVETVLTLAVLVVLIFHGVMGEGAHF